MVSAIKAGFSVMHRSVSTENYWNTLLVNYTNHVSHSDLTVKLNSFIEEFIDNGLDKDFLEAGKNAGAVLEHLFELEVLSSDCPAN